MLSQICYIPTDLRSMYIHMHVLKTAKILVKIKRGDCKLRLRLPVGVNVAWSKNKGTCDSGSRTDGLRGGSGNISHISNVYSGLNPFIFGKIQYSSIQFSYMREV